MYKGWVVLVFIIVYEFISPKFDRIHISTTCSFLVQIDIYMNVHKK